MLRVVGLGLRCGGGVFGGGASARNEPGCGLCDRQVGLREQARVRLLTDLVWPALATVLADAEARGHQPHQLLKEAAAQRELTTARQPARVLITRIQHTGRNPAPNRRAEAARLQATMAGSIPIQQTGNSRPPSAAPSPTKQQHRQRR
jgi:hypothetical protein